MADANGQGDGRIVVGIDGSPGSSSALEWATHQAELTGCTLTAVTTWVWPASFGVAFSYVPSDYNPSADAQKVLDAALAEFARLILTWLSRPSLQKAILPRYLSSSRRERSSWWWQPRPRRVRRDVARIGK